MYEEREAGSGVRLETALVTGAGKGLGAALARELSRRGLRVVLVARTEADVRRVAEEIREAGGTAHALSFDVADKSSVYRIATAAAALVGPIDVLVHNASTLGPTPMPLLLDTECEDLSAVLETNLVGPFRLTKALAGSMVLRERGVITLISSDAAVSAYEKWGAYGVSKAAADHLARSLAAEIGGRGVTVFVVDPGEMDTEMHAAAMPDADPKTLARPEHVAVEIAEMILGKRRAQNGERLVAEPRKTSEVTS